MEVYFIRHGATKGNLEHRYVGKTDEGILDSEWKTLKDTGEELGQMDCIFTSPLLRCVQSTEALSGKSQINTGGNKAEAQNADTHESRKQIPTPIVEVVDDLCEIDFGTFEYKNYQELNGNPDYQQFIDSGGRIAFPGGEEPEHFKARCVRAFENCLKRAYEEHWEKIAFVVHGGTIMAILETYGLPKQGYFDYQVKNGEGFSGTVIQGKYIQYQSLQNRKKV